jgi:hypothetical protein
MKKALLLVLLFVGIYTNAQLFTITNPHFTFHKTTDQSPAHWYIEVTSNVSVDTTLRWVAHFSNIPTQWNINFDDGTVNYNVIEDLDSGDFVLEPLAVTSLPLKLIIGAMLNDTPGHGSLFFDVFDPNNSTDKQTIQFEFIITPSTSSVGEAIKSSWYEINQSLVVLHDKDAKIEVYDELGKLIRKGSQQLNIGELSGLYFIHISSKSKEAIVRIIR